MQIRIVYSKSAGIPRKSKKKRNAEKERSKILVRGPMIALKGKYYYASCCSRGPSKALWSKQKLKW